MAGSFTSSSRDFSFASFQTTSPPVVTKKLVNLGLPRQEPLVQREVRSPEARANPSIAAHVVREGIGTSKTQAERDIPAGVLILIRLIPVRFHKVRTVGAVVEEPVPERRTKDLVVNSLGSLGIHQVLYAHVDEKRARLAHEPGAEDLGLRRVDVLAADRKVDGTA